jgi:hypothetical protein
LFFFLLAGRFLDFQLTQNKKTPHYYGLIEKKKKHSVYAELAARIIYLNCQPAWQK